MTEPVARPRPRARRERLRPYLPLLALVVAVGVQAWWARHSIFPAYSWNRDEPVYLWQVATLRSGAFTTTDGANPAFFQPWLSAAGEGSFYSQYTLGWPLVLLVGDLLGSTALALAFGCALAVVGTYSLARTVCADHRVGILAALVLALSPVLVVQGGVHLGYVFTLGLGTCFAAMLLSGFRGRHPVRLVLAGVLLGYVFLTRPFDAVLWAVAISVPLVLESRAELRRALRWLVPVAIGALPLVLAALAYNRHVTGSLFRFPINAADPLDTYGFGKRRIMPRFQSVDYGIVTATKGTIKNAAYVVPFLFGGVAGAALAIVAAWRARRDRASWPLFGILIAFPVGYFFFWGTNVSALTSRMSSPIYFVPVYAPLAILIAMLAARVLLERRAAGIGLLVVLFVAGLPFALNRIETNQRISEAQRPWQAASAEVRALLEPSLVFVADSGPYLMFLNPYSANDPDLDGHVLWAVDRGAKNLGLIAQFPDRVAYRMQASYRGDELGPTERPKTPEIALVRLEPRRAGALEVVAAITNAPGARHVMATFTIDGRERRVDATPLRGDDDRSLLRWLVPRPVNSTGTIIVGVGFGRTRDEARKPIIRQVVPYRVVEGEIEVLLPARAERLSDVGGGILNWRPTLDLPELMISVEASGDTARAGAS